MSWYKELEKYTVNKKIILFGAGTRTLNFFKMLPVNNSVLSKIEVILDNSSDKWGELFLNQYEVKSPSYLREINLSDVFIVITSGHYIEIEKQLIEEFQIRKENIYYNLDYMVDEQFFNWQIKEEFKGELEKLKLNLSDEKSKQILDRIINYRNNYKFDYSELKEDHQYFPTDIFEFSDREIFVDGGGYSGDTIEDFIHHMGDTFKQIYCFEPGEISFNFIQKKFINDTRIKSFNIGLWNKETTLFFEDNGLDLGNKVSDKGNFEIKVDSIDNLNLGPVTFIKMDIEGAELEALEGAKKTIQQYKPKLAICIYHKYDDLWRIPNYIKELVPEYKLYIRHHSLMNSDTVVYATL